ncbi:MAG: Uncharacterized protein XD63_0537 [Thermoanaerobacterales bacterium 50_218]|nr:MAG: Uncharacterized protein XD63_0537 [Thermoanaerobacterales bacterium 50_218]HAA89627.1 hypothetical protein [Peptococcaceae bacterium]
MQVSVDCIPCIIRQVINSSREAGVDPDEQYRILTTLLPLISRVDPLKSPAENASVILFEAYRMIGNNDPFKKVKESSNRLALSMRPFLDRVIGHSEDPLLTAIKVAVAGNIIDVAASPDHDVRATLEEELNRTPERLDYRAFLDLLKKGGPVVVIGDNSGEICFDFLLLAQLRKFTKELFYVVKSGPILNDATLEDAQEAGIDLLATVVTTGNNYLGIVPDLSSEEFIRVFREAHLVIAKGQANYETLEGTPFAGEKTFFLLLAKCPVIANHLGVKCGSSVLAQNRVRDYQ